MIYIGIDPGTHTGVAVWDSEKNKLLSLETLPIHQALDCVRLWQNTCSVNKVDVQVVFEDARQRRWFGKGDTSAKLQGAGSVKRDCSIWEDFCIDMGIAFRAVPPIKGGTKVSQDYFKKITHWTGRTSSHSRDAAMLVIGC